MAKNILERVLDRGHLVVGTGSGNVPWHFEDDDGDLAGFDVAMGRVLSKALFGSLDSAEFVIQDPNERISNVLDGRVDITIQFMSFSPDRLREVAFSVPYYTEGIGLILSANGSYRSYDDLVRARATGSRVTIAVLENPGADSEVDEILAGGTAEQQKDMATVYAAVESGGVDAGMADLSSIRWLASHQPERFLDSGLSTHPQNYGAAMHPDDQRWINYVNGVFLDAMTGASHGDYDSAFETYFGEKLPPPLVGKPGPYRSA